jgi:thiamine biosynthesis lipoprotein
MAVTLNGIAQGYITDRVADLLRARGWSNILIDLGEVRALDDHPEGRPWSIAIRDPKQPDQFLTRLSLRDQAVATSAGGATTFDGNGRHHHLFTPETGRSASAYMAVTVVADRAVTADALSTALFVMPRLQLARRLVVGASAKAWMFPPDGSVITLGS